ncbi:hypothetical protein ACIRBY_16515 [Streptomyces sp. NPDC096136]|uniref:hypothetical protein n=1 Tax=Streptomyces sp. NPDC096136 TaxID=3366076 RepID=UPI0038220922
MSIAQSVLEDELARDGGFSALLLDRLLQLLGPEALGVYGSVPSATAQNGSTFIVVPPAPSVPPASGPRRTTAWWVFLLGLPQFLLFFVIRLGLDTVNDGTEYQTAAPYLLLLLASIIMALIGLVRGLAAFRHNISGLLVVGTLLNAVVLLLLWQYIPSDLLGSFKL